MIEKPIAIFYEHPNWFKPLFAELDQRDTDYEKVHLNGHCFDPCLELSPYSLVVNRVSAYPSTISDPLVVHYVKQYLAYLESIGTRVINGWKSYEVGTSKAMQMRIFKKLGLNSPRSRVIQFPTSWPTQHRWWALIPYPDLSIIYWRFRKEPNNLLFLYNDDELNFVRGEE